MKSSQKFPGFTDETDRLRELVTTFVKKEIAPFAERWTEEKDFPKELFKKAGDVGLFGIRVDPKWGGSGLDWWATTAYVEALAQSESAAVNMALLVQSDMTLPVIETLGTEEQKATFLAPAVKGDAIACLGISEPGGGSDVAAMQCKAVKSGEDFEISGQKLWITNGTRADFVVLGVRTGEAGYKGISLLTFPTDTKGFKVGRKLNKIGNHASDTAELFFDHCRVPRRYLLGQENHGFKYIMENFQGERLVSAIVALAYMQKALDDAKRYASGRHAFGKPLGEFQVWRHRFAEHAASVEAARWLTYRAVDLANQGLKATREITMAKLFNTELMQKVLYDCMQVHGGFGYSAEYPIGRLWQDCRLYTIGAGASEVMKEIIAKSN